LDASNVEAAFQNILTGELRTSPQQLTPDIYRIVSSKSLESSGDVIKPTGGETIIVSPSEGDGGKQKNSQCC
jgi:Ras-related protein Rab-11A